MKNNCNEMAARVEAMSRSMERAKRASDALRRDLDRMEKLSAAVAELDEYQRSGLWLQDFEADEAGQIPAGVNRAVLAEDALYDLLREWDELRRRLNVK